MRYRSQKQVQRGDVVSLYAANGEKKWWNPEFDKRRFEVVDIRTMPENGSVYCILGSLDTLVQMRSDMIGTQDGHWVDAVHPYWLDLDEFMTAVRRAKKEGKRGRSMGSQQASEREGPQGHSGD